jgi:mono/diheme cytochrome c family protein
MTTLSDYDAMARRASMAKFIMLVLAVLSLCLFVGGYAFGGNKSCAVQLRHHHAVAVQPVIALNQVYPPSYYSVGAAIQEEAIAERVASLVLSKLAAMPAGQPAEPGAPEPIPGEHAQLHQSAVNASCVKCHSGDSPKAGIDLTNLSDLDCETRLAAIRAVLNQSMPKGGQLDPAEVGDVLTELAGEDPASAEGE